jgi:hypothetical protein
MPQEEIQQCVSFFVLFLEKQSSYSDSPEASGRTMPLKPSKQFGGFFMFNF